MIMASTPATIPKTISNSWPFLISRVRKLVQPPQEVLNARRTQSLCELAEDAVLTLDADASLRYPPSPTHVACVVPLPPVSQVISNFLHAAKEACSHEESQSFLVRIVDSLSRPMCCPRASSA